jgi:hypothetical protein
MQATLGALLLLLLFLSEVSPRGIGVVVAVQVAMPTDERARQQQQHEGATRNGAEAVFDSLEALNAYVYGAPYRFHEASSPAGAGPDGNHVITSSSNNIINSSDAATLDEKEVSEALELYTVTAYAASLTSPPQQRYRSEAAEVEVTTSSMCAADFTCPRSSVAWASGSFTASELLTPHSLALPVRLQLRLSLCCQYRFDGTLLRSRELYDVFLAELLQASPLQVLSATEKRALFPQDRIYIVDTWARKRVYNTSYTPTADDVAAYNDGDGDVLVLTTGLLTPAALLRVLSSSPALAGTGMSIGADASSNVDSIDNRGDGGGASPADAIRALSGASNSVGSSSNTADVQLRITNRVLKCKCPHTLTVMPLLHMRRDTLPPVAIAGLGSLCGAQPMRNTSSTSTTSHTAAAAARQRIRRVRRADGTVAFATSFELLQRLPPTTLVSWTVRQIVEETGEATADAGRSTAVGASTIPVLRHTRLLPVMVNASGHVQYSTAASPYFIVEPNERYEVAVTVSRGPPSTYARVNTADDVDNVARPTSSVLSSTTVANLPASLSTAYESLRITRRARGRFVLRLPFNRSWTLPPVQPTPHFGFRRLMRLSNATLSHAAVAAALDPQWSPSRPPSDDGSVAAGGPSSGGGGWFGLGRWTGSGGSQGASRAPHRTLSYYGYWENAPLRDQLLPQQPLHVPFNPFTNTSSSSSAAATAVGGVSMPLFIGRNLVAYVVRDVDDVCDPVVLEGREIWAVQSVIQTTGPVTACGATTDVAALVLRGLYLRMRREAKIEVTVPNTTWSTDRTEPAAAAALEGSYRCSLLNSRDTATAATGSTACAALSHTERDGSGCFASLQMNPRGVYEVVWTVRVAVRDARLAAPENLDPLYTTVRAVEDGVNTTGAVAVVEVRSHPLLVVRRQASFPAVVKVELPMHARRWTVSAPRDLASSSSAAAATRTGGVGSSPSGQVHDVLLDNAPAGYWRSRLPIRILSVDERLTAELDTDKVPNVQWVLPNGTLEFIAQDRGELLSLTTNIDGTVRAFPYTSRCPDTVVAYELHVVAFPPLPIVPAYAPIYTEEGCVVLVPPRALRKDEVAEWQVPPCAAAAAEGRSLYLVERTLSADEQEESAYVTTVRDGGEPLLTMASQAKEVVVNSTRQGGGSAAAVPVRQPVTVLMACGVEVYERCNVVWSVRNLVAEVHKTYSLRRCQRPPEVLFHQDSRQQRVSYPQGDVFQLPFVIETAYVHVNATPSTASATDAAGPTLATVMRRQRRPRRIIPIAGYSSALGYSFNYSGLQEHFEMHLHPLSDEVAHQLNNTQHDYVAAEDGAMVLRRRTLTDVQPLRLDHPRYQHIDAAWAAAAGENYDDNSNGYDADVFWPDYESNTAPLSTATPTDSVAAAHQRQRRLRAQQQRSQQLDQLLQTTYIIRHESVPRRLSVATVGNASLFPMDYVVRGSSTSAAAARNAAEAEEDRREFARRGMCVERPGHLAVLAVNPRGSVREDERYGTVLPAPPPPAVAVLPFCAPHYTFARFPELSTVYGYEYTWTCPEKDVITVSKYHATYSVLSHTPELAGGGGAVAVSSNKTMCTLTVVNHLTKTEQRDWFEVRRVFPSPLPLTALAVLSDNAATSLQIIPAARTTLSKTAGGGTSSRRNHHHHNATVVVVSMSELYDAPAGTYPFTKARHVVGKSVVLHVDAPSESSKARWAVESIVPAATIAVGSQVMMSAVEFEHLYHHPAAITRGRGGSTVLVKGLNTPGLYAVTHTLPDPENPSVCPPVTLTELLDVFHARVLEKELFVCGDTAALQAVPIPRAIAHEFVGQWEVMSLATDEKKVWTAGVNFTGIRFERGTRAETLVHGLPFGVVTMRWAIYRLLPLEAHHHSAVPGDGKGARENSQGQQQQRRRVLVDYDTVEVFVLTENLPSHRLVTLADRATILTTSSAQHWRMESAVGRFSDRTAAAVFTGVRMIHSGVTNYSHSSINPFTETWASDEAGRALLHTYYGLHPRPGSGALTLENLPVGTLHLHYDLVPSQSVFGKMTGHTCALHGHYEVERVSAYLTASTSLDHECDGYTGQGRITLCLHTEGAAVVTADHEEPGSDAGKQKDKIHRTRGHIPPDAQLWQSQVRLVDPTSLEDIIKRGAREVEQLSRGRCATPWWVAPSTQWLNPSYAASLAGTKESALTSLPGRCVTFAVKAGRHLSPREVAQPLFVSVPRGGLATPAAERDGSGVSAACPFHGDFISTRVIDGAPLVEGDAAALKPSSSSSIGSFFGFSQLFQLGLPHTAGPREGRGSDGAWGVHFLPVLQPSSLRRANATMRPMVGLRGALDDVTSELNISGIAGTALSLGGKHNGGAATVLLRLDLANAKHFGGYTVFSGGPAVHEPHSADSSSSSSSSASPAAWSEPYQSLLYKCVAGTVRGADVLQYWSETNRPDGMVDRTAQEWLDYAYAVRDTPVSCDVLFASLGHLVPSTYDPSYSAPQPHHISSGSASSSSSREWYLPRRRQPPPSSSSPPPPQQPPQYVTLLEMEQQVERIRKHYRWTSDGIDVTGLSADLQSALSHRRVTTMQLKAIEAARRARQAAEEAQAQQQQQLQRTQRELENAPSQMSPIERLASALRAYRGVAQGGEVAVLRIQLPLHESFTVPYDVFLRTALHKDVLCGTSVDPPPAMANPAVQPTVVNPHALVPLGRLEIRDAPPLLRLHPPVVKQCEVEGGLPVLTFELTGANFAHDRFTAEEVVLEEVPNPALATSGLVQPHHADVGLAACVTEMRQGLKAVVEAGSRKRLYLQLNACPHFKMLTAEEYNEHQDSQELLRRLQHSRYLRVTVRQAIRPDSFLLSRNVAAKLMGRVNHTAVVLQSTSSPSSSDAAVTPFSTDASFIVEVRPTLARLHLRSAANMELPTDARSTAARREGSGGREGVLLTQASGSGGGGSWWSRGAHKSSRGASYEDADGVGRGDASTPTAATAESSSSSFSASSFAPTPARPLVLCESDLYRYGFQLGIELIGDTWTKPVGEDGATATTTTTATAAATAALPRQRAPPNVALMNSFSVVEHHSLDSSHHLYMKGGGVYRSHFINYVFSVLLKDPTVLREHNFVYRYNSTFASIVLPPLSAVPRHRSGYGSGGAFAGVDAGEDDVDVYIAQQQQQQQRQRQHTATSYSTTVVDAAAGGVALPAVRQFCKVEEILFAVPGIATECRGCLLADTTFFVAGDLTGIWTPTNPHTATSQAAARWSSESFTRPLVVPWDSAASIPRVWVFDWVCPTAAHRALERLGQHVSRITSGSDLARLSVVMDVVLYRVRGRNGEELPAMQRPTVLLSSEPVPLVDVLTQNRAATHQASSSASLASTRLWTGQNVLAAPLQLHVSESVAGAAYTRLAEDVLRHRRHAWAMMEYHRNNRDAGGVLVVNASVFLKVCADQTACTVVSITDALLAVEAPKVVARSTSWLRRALGRRSSTTATGTPSSGGAAASARRLLSISCLLHHASMTYLCYELLPLLGLATPDRNARHDRGGRRSAPSSGTLAGTQPRAGVRYAALAFLLLLLSYKYAPVLWVGLCLAIWSLSLYVYARPELIFLFVGSVLYARCLM